MLLCKSLEVRHELERGPLDAADPGFHLAHGGLGAADRVTYDLLAQIGAMPQLGDGVRDVHEQIIGLPIFVVNRYSDPMGRDNIGMSIGSRIREARKARKWSQTELGTRCGLAQNTISELETGESQGTTYLARLASALEVSALWLETGKGVRDVTGTSFSPPGALDLRAQTAAELQMLMVYRSANELERKEIDAVIEDMRLLIEARARDQGKRTG